MALAHVDGADPHREAARLRVVDDEPFDLLDEFLLDLQPRREVVDDPVVLRQADDLAFCGRQDADDGVSVDRHQVMRTGRTNRERARHDQLVATLDVVELGDFRRLGIAAPHRLLDEHLGDAGRCIARVVVVAVIDHQHVEQLFELASHGLLHRGFLRVVHIADHGLVPQTGDGPGIHDDDLVHPKLRSCTNLPIDETCKSHVTSSQGPANQMKVTSKKSPLFYRLLLRQCARSAAGLSGGLFE